MCLGLTLGVLLCWVSFSFCFLQFCSLLSDFIFRDKPYLFFFDLLQCAKMGPSVVLGCPTPQVDSLCCYPTGVFLPWHSVVVGCCTPQVGSVCCYPDPVDVHCVMMSDPVYACRYHPVNVHGLMMSDPVCACAYYPVSVYWSWMTFCAPLHAGVSWMTLCVYYTLWVFIVYSWMLLCMHVWIIPVSVHCLVMNDPVCATCECSLYCHE